jgi:diguanylate cyclase (GGDEF)-like protein/PAS domain S-box-containing protein
MLHDPQASSLNIYKVLAILTIICLFGLNWSYLQSKKSAKVQLELESSASAFIISASGALHNAAQDLKAVSAIINLFESAEHLEVARFSKNYLEEDAGLLVIEWIPHALETDIESFIRDSHISSQGHSSLSKPNLEVEPVLSKVNAENASALYMLIHKEIRNSTDLDRGWSENTTASKIKARDNAAPQASDFLSLHIGKDKNHHLLGLVIIYPIYTEGAFSNTVAKRRENLLGYMAGIYSLKVLLSPFMKKVTSEGINIKITDNTNSGLVAQMKSGEDTSHTRVAPMSILGKDWMVELTANEQFVFKTKGVSWYLNTVLLIVFGVVIVLFFQLVERRNKMLSASKEQLANRLHNTPLAAISWDESFKVSQWNIAAEKIFGYTADEAIGRHPIGLIVSDLLSEEMDEIYKALMENKGEWRHNNDNITKDGRVINCEWYNTTLFDGAGKVIGVASLCEDVTARKQSELKIWEQANYDSLTKLANRQMASDYLEHEIKISDRSNKSIALLFLDLDGFKDINDTLGHDVGDTLLLEVARRLNSYTRDVDTVARVGGDEFVVIMGGLDSSHPAERIASDLLKKIAEPFALAQETVFISASIGITIYPQDASDAVEMLKNADQAMYAAKQNGGNSFYYFMPSMQHNAINRMSVISDLRKALSDNQFQLYYQPIVSLANGDIYKAEALIRWQHPERGLIGPFEFIPIAEETRLILGIGDWVFREACQQSAQWRAAFHPNFQISVNTSPVQYKSDAFSAKAWLEYLQALNLPGDAIAVEITEGTLMETGKSIDQILFDFRDANIQVSLDDFGTGYSSLATLKKLDIDYLKIDKLFVDNLAHNSDDLVLCEAIIVMAHKLGLKVIAEGIETEQQRDLLIAAGCDYGQGYLFAKPLPAIEFEALLKSG